MKCPSCNKFCAFNTDTEPEVEVNIDNTEFGDKPDPADESKRIDDPDNVVVHVDGTVRIVLTSECCSEEMKESNFDVSDLTIDVERAEGCACDLTTDLSLSTSQSISDRTETSITKTIKRGPDKGKTKQVPINPRYQKRYYGAELTMEVTCKCGKTSVTEEWHDEVQASGMDEL